MEIIKEITDGDYPIDTIFRVREAVRAVLFDENNLIPLLFVSKYNYHKLPGGGIDEGEDKAQALVRECLEEVGSEITIRGEIGQINESYSKMNFKKISYCYYGTITKKGLPHFTEEEVNQGFKIVWLTLQQAILKIQNDKPNNYEGVCIQKREIEILKRAAHILESSNLSN